MPKSKDKKNMTVTYLVNGKPISAEELKTIKITRKDYIDFVESLKKQFNEPISESRSHLLNLSNTP